MGADESTCQRCGGPNRVWYAPSPLWNEVMRGGSINGDEEYGIVCPTCFMVLAEERGIAGCWRLDARDVHVELETVTPSGRRWDVEADRWSAPDGDVGECNCGGPLVHTTVDGNEGHAVGCPARPPVAAQGAGGVEVTTRRDDLNIGASTTCYVCPDGPDCR